jgi:TatA/E family protein of Tat protein translocase
MEIIVILLAVLLLFGGKKLPEFARNLGRGINALKREFSEFKKSMDLDDINDKEQKG